MIDVFKFIESCNFTKTSVILEIGAHMGFDTEKIHRASNGAKIFAFEPDPRNIAILKERQIDGIARIIESAVSDADGTAEFFLSSGDTPTESGNDYYDYNDWSASSSLRKFKNHSKVFPWCTMKSEPTTVQTITLDTFCKSYGVAHIDFIWMDVQGVEDLIFKGGQDALLRTEFIYTEYSNQELYEGQKTLDELMALLPGWKVKGFDESGYNVFLENTRYRLRKIRPNGIWTVSDTVEHVFDRPLAKGIKKMVTESDSKTMYDFGCGDGKYVKFLKASGLDIKGFDGNPNTPMMTNGECAVLDLSVPFKLQPVDWVISLEVGEHIPGIYMDVYINNLISHATKGVILSWGVPGQGGFGHVNCLPNSTIIEAFEGRGFKYKVHDAQYLRWCANSSWFKDTIMVFKRKEDSDEEKSVEHDVHNTGGDRERGPEKESDNITVVPV